LALPLGQDHYTHLPLFLATDIRIFYYLQLVAQPLLFNYIEGFLKFSSKLPFFQCFEFFDGYNIAFKTYGEIMITAGILSDTHLYQCTDKFRNQVHRAFAECDIIFHAGDVTALAVLDAFCGKKVYGVHGNMCDYDVQRQLPHHKLIELEGYSIGICHGAGPRHNIEERVWHLFPEADCIIYGHTHRPVCEKKGGVLFINPGSFHSTGPHGATPTYGILEIGSDGLNAKIHSLPHLP
jgi:uncharacterized protein